MSETLGLAAYQRVVQAIKADIRNGRLAVGDKLPGNRTLAEQHDVALGTLQKALKVGENEGWLTATPTVGVFVKAVPGEDGSTADIATVLRRLDDLQATVDALADKVRRLEEIER